VPSLHVERAGSGAPVVFLHGVAGSGATYAWLPELGRTIVRPDFRGHGRSERAPGAYLIAHYVDDAVAVLRDTGPAAIVGHSLGGVVAWTIAQRHPELVTAIVLEDPPLYLGEPAEHARNGAVPAFKVLRACAARWQDNGTDQAAAASWLAAQPYRPHASRRDGEVAADDAVMARAYALLRLDPTVLDAIIDGTALAATDVEAPLAVPALVLAADDALGAAFATRHERRLTRTHPQVQVRRMAGAGHRIHDQGAHRADYLRAVREFI
jgi:pimeloyl-ACP methyl ester carboxylesterase